MFGVLRWGSVRVLCVAVLCVGGAPAQTQTQESLVERRDAKLQSAFLRNADWTMDYDAARKKSAQSGKLILAYFTRSYLP